MVDINFTTDKAYRPRFQKGDIIRNIASMYVVTGIKDVHFAFGSAPFYEVIILEDPWAAVGCTGTMNVYETDLKYFRSINYNKLWDTLNGQV